MTTKTNENFKSKLYELLIFINTSIIDDENQDLKNIYNFIKIIKKTIKKYNFYILNIDTIESKKIKVLYKYLDKIINIMKVANIYKSLKLPLLYNLKLLDQKQTANFIYIWDSIDNKTNDYKYVIKCVKCGELKNKFYDYSRYSRNDNINKCKVCIKKDSKTKREQTMKIKEETEREYNEVEAETEADYIFWGYD